MDLRQRRKLETTEHIQEMALSLARARGVAAVTVEAICDAAGISQRTFFNYFPFKEAVFVLPPPPFPDEIVGRFLAGRGNLMDDLIDLMEAQARLTMWPTDAQSLRQEIEAAHPRLMSLQMEAFQKFQGELCRVIARRLGVTDDDLRCVVLAGAAIGANRAAIDRSIQAPEADFPQLVREGLKALTEIIRSSDQTPLAGLVGKDQSGARAPSRG